MNTAAETRATQNFEADVHAASRGERSAFLKWWKANEKRFPTHQFARAEFDRLLREAVISALEPFANEAARLRNYPDDYPYSLPTTPITVGDFRRAAKALANLAA